MIFTSTPQPSKLNSISRVLLVFVPTILLSTTLEQRDMMILTLFVMTITAISGIGFREISRVIVPALTMCAVTLVLHLLFTRTDGGMTSLVGPFTIHHGAITIGLMYCWRIVLMFLLGSAFVKWIRQEEFAELVWRILLPLRWLKIPVHDIAMSMTIALRFIPLLLAEYRRIELVQKCRGVRIGGNWISRIRRAAPIIVPAFASALRKIDTTADALVVRGWGIAARRTFYREIHFRVLDLISSIGLLAIILLVIVEIP